MELLELAARIEDYDPKLSPDNRDDELELHRDIVLATGEGSMNPRFEATFVRSLDAAMTLVPEGLRRLLDEQRAEWVVTLWADKFTPIAEARALTAALALCAAA